MHCVAGDGVGILFGAVIGGALSLAMSADIALEYVLGFGFGWTIFQALFMKDSAGGSYPKALQNTFIPELVSMNCLMAAMVPISSIVKANVPGSESPLTVSFWFIMSMALLAGFIAAYPMNWWLVTNHLKHGMMTVRPKTESSGEGMSSMSSMKMEKPGYLEIALVTLLSFLIMAVGIAIAFIFA